jgi:uncharacterized damage-inducible protein DinB
MTAPALVSAAGATAALTPADWLYGDFAAEHAATRRILERYPDGRGEWRPHERSRTLAQLATHVADIVNRGTTVLGTDGMDIGGRQPVPPMDTACDLLAHFEAGVTRFTASLEATDLERFAQPWALRGDGRVLMESPRRILLRLMMMSHLVHHRAQLGVYYRLLGVPVPGMYGPSADD